MRSADGAWVSGLNMDGLEALASRPVIISGAIAGALMATLGPFALRRAGIQSRWVLSTVARLGHAVSWVSVGLFIAAGFLYNY